MKTAKQWVDEHSQSGPFDCVGSSAEAETIVGSIQADATSTRESELLTLLDELLVVTNVHHYGPGGVNMGVIRRAYDALAAGVKDGRLPRLTVSIARDMQTHGWDIGFPLD